MAQRGSYAKGVVKREEILEKALEVVAREGVRGASVKEIADAVGLSQAGLLHYFDSKEELFTEVLRKRDQQDFDSFGVSADSGLHAVRDRYAAAIRHNTQVPGLVHLFARLSVDAVDPQHPAHAYFIERGEQLRTTLAHVVTAAQDAGHARRDIDPDTLARVLQAVSDGLQLQWMLDPELDMAAIMVTLLDVFDIDAAVSASPE